MAATHTPDPRRYVLRSQEIRRAQRRHAAWAVGLPLLLTLAGPLYLPSHIDPWLAVGAFAIMATLVAGLGISVGFHRHFAHRSFKAAPWLRWLMAVAGQMAAQGPVMYWTALHRRHHSFSDQPGDPHSPAPTAQEVWRTRAAAFWHAHVGWSLDHPVPMPSRYVPDLLADKPIRRLNGQYVWCVLAGLVLPTLLGAVWARSLGGAITGLYFGGFFRLAITTQGIWGVNSICHRFGSRPHDTGDHSTNHLGWALFTYGEGWHNNHHHDATSARFGQGWRQPDAGWVMVATFRRLGWVWDVREGHDGRADDPATGLPESPADAALPRAN